MKEGASAAEMFFSPQQVPEAVGNLSGMVRGILIFAELSVFHTLKTKNVSVMEQPPEKPWSERLKAALSCPLTCRHQPGSSYKHTYSRATASSCNTGVYSIYRKEKSQGRYDL